MSFESEWNKHPELSEEQMRELLRRQSGSRLKAFFTRGYQTQEALDDITDKVTKEYKNASRKSSSK